MLRSGWRGTSSQIVFRKVDLGSLVEDKIIRYLKYCLELTGFSLLKSVVWGVFGAWDQ